MFFQEKLVSIITVCRNDLAGVRLTSRSAASQVFTEYEHIFIDGASSDGTAEYIEELKDDRIILVSEPDNGISDAFNKGIRIATGKYILFLNAGDSFISDDILLEVGEKLENGQDIEVFASEYATGTLPEKMSASSFAVYWKKAMLPHQSTFVKRKVFSLVGGFDTSLKLRMDYDFFYRCVKAGIGYNYTEKVIVKYAAGGASSENPILFNVEGAEVYHRYEPSDAESEYYSILSVHGLSLDDDTAYLISPYGLGDTMILCAFYKELESKIGHTITFVIKKGHDAVMRMHGIKRYVVCQFSSEELFILASRCHHPMSGSLFVAHPRFHDHTSVKALDCEGITITEMYKRFLGLEKSQVIRIPKNVPEVSDSLTEKLGDIAISDIVMVAPEMTSYYYPQILNIYFERLIDSLIASGESVLVNLTVSGFNLNPKAISPELSVDELVTIAARCKKVISARSGFCDLIWPFAKELIVIYPDSNFLLSYGIVRSYESVIPITETVVGWKEGLRRADVHKYGIYGMGPIGRCLGRIFRIEGCDPEFYMDRNVRHSEDGIPVYSPYDDIQDADTIIVTIRRGWEELVLELKKRFGVRVLYYTEIIPGYEYG